jgi:dTDP-4-dehydrorhamnose reductase
MKISLIGYSGFLGRELIKYFKYNKKIKIIKINARLFKFEKKRNTLLEKIFSSDVIINCAASLKPKNENDLFINANFPKLLCDYNKKTKKRILHISTINVLVKDRLDRYSLSKKEAEKKIIKEKNVVIIRLPLLFKKDDVNFAYKAVGNIKFFFEYLNINFLPFYPMICPGHIYKPLELKKVLFFIKKTIFLKKTKKIYNLQGRVKKSLFDIFNEIAQQLNKKVCPVNFRIFNEYSPEFIIKFFKKRNSFLQQLVIIKNYY